MAVVTKRADRMTGRYKSKNQIHYSDFKTSFNIITNRDVELVENDISVIQAVYNLINTNIGERLYNPLYGCDIRSLLFENITPQTESVVTDRIRTAIENYEPRVKLSDVVVEMSPDDNAVAISITFYLLNKQETTTLEFVLVRIR